MRKTTAMQLQSDQPRVATLLRDDMLRLMLESGCSSDTVRKWARGDEVRQATNGRLSKAARKLGLELKL